MIGRIRAAQRRKELQRGNERAKANDPRWTIDEYNGLAGHERHRYDTKGEFVPVDQDVGAFETSDDVRNFIVEKARKWVDLDGLPKGIDWNEAKTHFSRILVDDLVQKSIENENRDQNASFALWSLGKHKDLCDPLITPFQVDRLVDVFPELKNFALQSINTWKLYMTFLTRLVLMSPNFKDTQHIEYYYRYCVAPMKRYLERALSDETDPDRRDALLKQIKDDMRRDLSRPDYPYPHPCMDPKYNPDVYKFPRKYMMSPQEIADGQLPEELKEMGKFVGGDYFVKQEKMEEEGEAPPDPAALAAAKAARHGRVLGATLGKPANRGEWRVSPDVVPKEEPHGSSSAVVPGVKVDDMPYEDEEEIPPVEDDDEGDGDRRVVEAEEILERDPRNKAALQELIEAADEEAAMSADDDDANHEELLQIKAKAEEILERDPGNRPAELALEAVEEAVMSDGDDEGEEEFHVEHDGRDRGGGSGDGGAGAGAAVAVEAAGGDDESEEIDKEIKQRAEEVDEMATAAKERRRRLRHQPLEPDELHASSAEERAAARDAAVSQRRRERFVDEEAARQAIIDAAAEEEAVTEHLKRLAVEADEESKRAAAEDDAAAMSADEEDLAEPLAIESGSAAVPMSLAEIDAADEDDEKANTALKLIADAELEEQTRQWRDRRLAREKAQIESGLSADLSHRHLRRPPEARRIEDKPAVQRAVENLALVVAEAAAAMSADDEEEEDEIEPPADLMAIEAGSAADERRRKAAAASDPTYAAEVAKRLHDRVMERYEELRHVPPVMDKLRERDAKKREEERKAKRSELRSKRKDQPTDLKATKDTARRIADELAEAYKKHRGAAAAAAADTRPPASRLTVSNAAKHGFVSDWLEQTKTEFKGKSGAVKGVHGSISGVIDKVMANRENFTGAEDGAKVTVMGKLRNWLAAGDLNAEPARKDRLKPFELSLLKKTAFGNYIRRHEKEVRVKQILKYAKRFIAVHETKKGKEKARKRVH